jgi:hypothetical protein
VQEFIQALRKLGLTKVGHEESYQMMTKKRRPDNHTGEMTLEEFKDTMMEYLRSECAPGLHPLPHLHPHPHPYLHVLVAFSINHAVRRPTGLLPRLPAYLPVVASRTAAPRSPPHHPAHPARLLQSRWTRRAWTTRRTRR